MNQKVKKQEGGMKAIIIDMSEVLIHTEIISKNAWDRIFNDLLKNTNASQSFNDEDYYTFIEGKPKFERVQNFLSAQNISLPFGSQSDPADIDTICSLEKRKSKLFSQLLNTNELQVYEKALQKIKQWKKNGLKTAIVSSDENFKKALNSSEIRNLFDVKIDGHASRKRGLKEKPEADLYVEAAKELDLPPESCVLFDDSVAGLQAGSKANYGLVVGVNRTNNRKELSENGADMVIDTFQDFDLFDNAEIDDWFIQSIPPFASEYSKIGKAVYKKIPVVFLDYDGTLTPIVQQPEDAILSKEMQDVLKNVQQNLKLLP
jgi:trehalose 6-phosphate phosphatase